ncbi:aminoglycoside phosphotransferase family protein [Pseudoalteromonas luteoviolacea]|uniref:aminoglycoside phosphotransferase family protein n=1 Tax=Pseudoalteromonas luteoviolacea TaxID=43657 RepID=UPI00114F079B|nr:phosphotransferase [Pseudoalteromonas luteoviolacea]TQF69836.1 phosphotransferase [Pseudoalteromonas luteoviolacea]
MTRPNSQAIAQRQKDRLQFIEQYLGEGAGCQDLHSIEAITGDASFRLYFRVQLTSQDLILMDVTPDKGSIMPFIELNKDFQNSGLAVPTIHAFDVQLGFVLLEDLGSTHLADIIEVGFDKQKYSDLLQWLPRIASMNESNWMKPYDADFIHLEINIFRQWLVESWLGMQFPKEFEVQWQSLTERLTEQMLSQPQTVMHRDFHSRNIMYSGEKGRLIDYQDAVVGPVCYDAVSLLKDCYIKLPKEDFLSLREESFQRLDDAGVLGGMTYPQYIYHFDLTGVQRHLKAAGIFARLNLRDGKSGYLQNIVPTLLYVVEAANSYKEFQWLATWLQSEIIPSIKIKLQS